MLIKIDAQTLLNMDYVSKVSIVQYPRNEAFYVVAHTPTVKDIEVRIASFAEVEEAEACLASLTEKETYL